MENPVQIPVQDAEISNTEKIDGEMLIYSIKALKQLFLIFVQGKFKSPMKPKVFRVHQIITHLELELLKRLGKEEKVNYKLDIDDEQSSMLTTVTEAIGKGEYTSDAIGILEPARRKQLFITARNCKTEEEFTKWYKKTFTGK